MRLTALQPGLRHCGDTLGQDLGQKQHCPQRRGQQVGVAILLYFRRMLAALLCLHLNFSGSTAPHRTPRSKLLIEGVTPTVSCPVLPNASVRGVRFPGRMAEGRSWDSGFSVLSWDWAGRAGSYPPGCPAWPLADPSGTGCIWGLPSAFGEGHCGERTFEPVPGSAAVAGTDHGCDRLLIKPGEEMLSRAKCTSVPSALVSPGTLMTTAASCPLQLLSSSESNQNPRRQQQ